MTHVYPVQDEFAKRSRADSDQFRQLYRESIDNNEQFWQQQAKRIDWQVFPSRISDVSYHREDFRIRWYEDGELNVCANCVDRHLDTKADKTAIIWQGDEPDQARHLTYRDLHREVCIFANVLTRCGVEKGDRVIIYLPMIPQAAIAMLACARIGAVHSVVFGGFSPDSLAMRINDCSARLVITADAGIRGGRIVPLKRNVDEACARDGVLDSLDHVLVIRDRGHEIDWHDDRDLDFAELAAGVPADCPAVAMNAEDPLFILYTSGSTGKPKGVLHTSGGYLVFASLTHELVFDIREDDIYWCTADVGWITGHSYIVYGPLANGCTTLMFEGVPNYPDASRFWQICDQHRVSVFYTAPTAIRALMREGDAPVEATSRKTLRLLGTVGEPINPEAWEWYHRVVGGDRCPSSTPGGRPKPAAS